MHGFNAPADAEIERLGAVILAAEPWSTEYEKDPESHAKLIRLEAKFETSLRQYFREMAEQRINSIVDWWHYTNEAVKAYDVNVTINDEAISAEEGILLTFVYDPVAEMMATGAQAGEAIYDTSLGFGSSTASIQKAARQYSGKLVSAINATTRDKIRQSIATSLSLGEDQKTAAARVNKIIRDTYRAGMIARTEAVNSYSMGLDAFGVTSGAVSKTWQSIGGACAICAPLNEKTVGISDNFPGIDRPGPTAHPNCRCGKVLNYENHA